MPQTCVSGVFQLCGQQCADGQCHAATQCLSAVVLGVCFEFRAAACQLASHCNERCLSLNPSNGKVHSVTKHNYKCMLDDGIY